MENNNQIVNQPNGTQENENSLNIRDLIFIVINNWYWFVVSVLLCLVVTAFVYKSKPKTFTDNAQILLRDESGNKSYSRGQNMDAIFANMGFGNNGLSLENEMYIIKSTPLLMKTAERLGMNYYCVRDNMFKKVSYYSDAPMQLKVYNAQVDSVQLSVSMEVTPADKNSYTYKITSVNGHKVKDGKKKASFNQVINLNKYSSFSIERTDAFKESDVDVTFNMGYSPLYNVAMGMKGRMNVSRLDKQATILSITYSDANAWRAKDVIDTLITVYNEDVINDKNVVAEKTEKFIDDRIELIYGELNAVDAQVAAIQRGANVPDLTSAGSTVLQSGIRYTDEVSAIEVELQAVKMVQEHVTNHANDNALIPSLIISDAGVSNLISVYNSQLLSYQRLLQGAGPNHPSVQNSSKELQKTREAIIASINNLINSLNVKLNAAKRQERMSQQRINEMPTQSKAVTEVTRQQKIKEELYLYLLSKREENAMSLASTIANAKVVESAVQTGVKPSLMMFALVGLVLGLAIPALIMFCISFFDYLFSKLITRKDKKFL